MAVVKIHEERRTESFGDDGVSVKRVLRVTPWAARLDVIERLLGGVRMVGNTLVRIPPSRDRELPFCFCTGVEVEGLGSIVGASPGDNDHLDNVHEYTEGGLLTASYTTLDYEAQEAGDGTGNSQNGNQSEQQEIDLASEGLDFATKSITLPNRRMGWDQVASPGDPPVDQLMVKTDQAATKVLPQVQYHLTRHYVARLPTDAILKLLGRVNKSEFRVGPKKWPAETVRFDSLSTKRKATNRGVKFYECVYKFAIFPVWDVCADDVTRFVGWNRGYRVDTGKWQYMVWASNPAKKAYDSDEDIVQKLRGRDVKGFNLLFHPRAK